MSFPHGNAGPPSLEGSREIRHTPDAPHFPRSSSPGSPQRRQSQQPLSFHLASPSWAPPAVSSAGLLMALRRLDRVGPWATCPLGSPLCPVAAGRMEEAIPVVASRAQPMQRVKVLEINQFSGPGPLSHINHSIMMGTEAICKETILYTSKSIL